MSYCNLSLFLFFLGFTSPEDVQVSNSTTGSTPSRRRSADTNSCSRRKLSVEKGPKDSLSSINELNTKNKKSDAETSSSSSSSSSSSRTSGTSSSSSSSNSTIGISSNRKDTEKSTLSKKDTERTTSKNEAEKNLSSKNDSPQVEITKPTKKYTIDTKVSTKTPSTSSSTASTSSSTASMSPSSTVEQDRASTQSHSFGRQQGSSRITGLKKSLVNGDVKATDTEESKPATVKTANKFSQPVIAKEPIITSKPPTAQQNRLDVNKDKSNSFKRNFENKEDKGPAMTTIKDVVKETHSPSAKRISQYNRLSGSEALHIFHPTRRSATPKSGDFGDTNSELKEEEERAKSPSVPKSPVPDKRGSSLKRASNLTISTSDDVSQQQPSPTPPRSPKSPVQTSVTGTRRPGVVESKTKKMLALMGKEASVDSDRPADIPRSAPVS